MTNADMCQEDILDNIAYCVLILVVGTVMIVPTMWFGVVYAIDWLYSKITGQTMFLRELGDALTYDWEEEW